MKIFFESQNFDDQLLRTLAYTPYGGADIGECFTIAKNIKKENLESWRTEWFKFAERLYKEALESEKNNQDVSAFSAYLRASNYFRTAGIFLYDFDKTEELKKIYDLHCETFAKAIGLFSQPLACLRIPFQGTFLPGYFYKSKTELSTSPTLIVNGGFDGTQQESYFLMASAALQRGYNVLTFDGPGQGEPLIKHNIYMRPDWEVVINAITEFLLDRDDVDKDQIVLTGTNFGGYLAARGASDNHHIAALVLVPGMYDLLDVVRPFAPEIDAYIQKNDNVLLEQFGSTLLEVKMISSRVKARMFIHGQEIPGLFYKEWAKYNLVEKAKGIHCPTLVVDTENELFSSGQALKLFNALTCPKEYLMIKNEVGGGEHCAFGALVYLHQKMFDWLGETLKNNTIKAYKHQ